MLGFFSKKKQEQYEQGLTKTRENLFSKLSRVFVGKSTIDETTLDDIEEALISADVSLQTTIKIIDQLQERIKKARYLRVEEIYSVLEEVILSFLPENAEILDFDAPLPHRPYVFLIVGVNGVGKTTTIGKMAYAFKQAGKKVLLGAADTFRAAAVDQLKIWAERAGVDIYEKGSNVDPGAVAYETVSKAVSQNYDVVIIDTAGRLHNKVNLMNELGKIRRVISKVIEIAPHQVLLVLDASTGQNAIEQAKQFTTITQLTGLILTKLDGTARGGVVVSIADMLKIPIHFVGLGEKIEDLQVFDPHLFVKGLFKDTDLIG